MSFCRVNFQSPPAHFLCSCDIRECCVLYWILATFRPYLAHGPPNFDRRTARRVLLLRAETHSVIDVIRRSSKQSRLQALRRCQEPISPIHLADSLRRASLTIRLLTALWPLPHLPFTTLICASLPSSLIRPTPFLADVDELEGALLALSTLRNLEARLLHHSNISMHQAVASYLCNVHSLLSDSATTIYLHCEAC